MTDPRLDGRARQRRNLGDGNAQQGEIAAGVSPDELRGNASTVGKTDLISSSRCWTWLAVAIRPSAVQTMPLPGGGGVRRP